MTTVDIQSDDSLPVLNLFSICFCCDCHMKIICQLRNHLIFVLSIGISLAAGDGKLYNYHINASNGSLTERKVISLGTKPISLHRFRSNNTNYVFAASDRPTIIYSNNQKLLYSNLNEEEVSLQLQSLFSAACKIRLRMLGIHF